MASPIQLDSRGLIVPCPSCGQKNRLGFETLDAEHRCGQCKTAVAAPASTVEIRSAGDFDALVTRSALPVVIDYWAPWCGPCRMVAPELEKLAARHAGELLIAKLNTDEVPGIAARYGIMSIPTMAVFANGQEKTRSAGARPAAAIEALIRDAGVRLGSQ